MESKNKYKCGFCTSSFTRKDNLKVHIKKLHQQADVNKVLENLEVVNVQLKQKPHVCKTCSKSFSRASHLRQHEGTHDPDRKKIACPLCNEGFVNASSLKRHNKVAHAMELANSDVTTIMINKKNVEPSQENKDLLEEWLIER